MVIRYIILNFLLCIFCVIRYLTLNSTDLIEVRFHIRKMEYTDIRLKYKNTNLPCIFHTQLAVFYIFVKKQECCSTDNFLALLEMEVKRWQ